MWRRWLPRSARFGEGEIESLLAADALFESGGIEVEIAADLPDGEGDGAEAGRESLWFEAVGVARSGLGALERLGLEHDGAFRTHGLVDENAEARGEGFGTLVGKELKDGFEEFRMILAGHVRCGVGCGEAPRPELTWPALCRSRSRRRLPCGSWASRQKSNLQKDFYIRL